MYCSKCNDPVELETKKNPESNMWENYWWCRACECRTLPMTCEPIDLSKIIRIEIEREEEANKAAEEHFNQLLSKGK